MSASSLTSNTSESSSSFKEVCVVCQDRPYDLVCTCEDKFCFTCIHAHVEQIGLEFQYVQNEVGERLLRLEQTVEDINCTDAKEIVENWKRKRIQDINDIADGVLNQIGRRENVYAEVAPIRVQYNRLSEDSNRVVHEQLTSMVTIQRQVLEKFEQLETLPQPLCDTTELDLKLQSKFDPNILNQCQSNYQNESVHTLSTKISDPETPVYTKSNFPTPLTTIELETRTYSEPIPVASVTAANTGTLTNTDSNSSPPVTPVYEVPQVNAEPPAPLTNVPTDNDEFDAGQTTNIQRRNPIIISINNDRSVATVCCHENQLLYNDYSQGNRNPRLTFVPDLTRSRDKQHIQWNPPETLVGGGDDDWIQDITYSGVLRGYLLLNRSRLRFLHDNTLQMEEFYQFPDRSMKRVTCNDSFIYLILASGVTGQNGDEIILMNYAKEEVISKTFRDIVLYRNRQMTGPIVGEISDIAVNNNGQVIFGYRLERRQEVGVCLYNVSNTGHEWTSIKQLLLNECWHNDLSYTPRVEWCKILNMFVLVEYMTGHLIMLDQNGQVKGETRFTHVQNQREVPLNLSISNDLLCIRYESSINIHRLDDGRL